MKSLLKEDILRDLHLIPSGVVDCSFIDDCVKELDKRRKIELYRQREERRRRNF